jgi:hypothetical protein
MTDHSDTIHRFYKAFAQLDAATMAACYAPEATFSDEAFTLNGRDEVVGMWTMLCTGVREKAREDWRLEYDAVTANGLQGSAHWEAHYRFTATGRLVHNRIDASFTFNEQGLIVKHVDHFNFWRWARQALGAPGWLLGWSSWFQAKVRAKAQGNLTAFRAANKG